MKYLTILVTLFLTVSITDVQAQACCPTKSANCCAVACCKTDASKASVEGTKVAMKAKSCTPAQAAKSCTPAELAKCSASAKATAAKSCAPAAKTVSNPSSDWSVEKLLKLAGEKTPSCKKFEEKSCAPAKAANTEKASDKAIASKQ